MTTKPPAIISLEEFTESVNMCIYSDPGVGKTVFAGTAPNALFLAVEAGTVSAKRQGSTADLWPINTWDDLQAAYDWLHDNPDVYTWVIIDTATQMQRLCMRGILNAAVAENRSRDLDIPALQDWNKYYNMFQRFVLAFNDLPVNVLWLAHTMKNEDEDGETLILPEISGPSHSPLREAQMFCAQMGVVAYYKKSVQGRAEDAVATRSLLFEAMPPHFAKDRYAVFPRWVKVTEGDGKDTKQFTTMADIDRRIGNKPPSQQPAKRPAKKVPPKPPAKVAAKASAVRPRPNR